MMLMFAGRVGALTFGFALLNQKNEESKTIKTDDLAV
jgi:trk system potassium uptake protein TrkH